MRTIAQHSVFSFLRTAGEQHVLVVLNFTPVPRHDWRVGVPALGRVSRSCSTRIRVTTAAATSAISRTVRCASRRR